MKIRSLLETDEEERASKFAGQAVWFYIHAILALGSWLTLRPVGVLPPDFKVP